MSVRSDHPGDRRHCQRRRSRAAARCGHLCRNRSGAARPAGAVLRDQNITQQQQRDFAARFGPLHIHPIYPQSDAVPEIMILDTARNDLRDNALWHSDVSFVETPPLGAVLAAKVLPDIGGDTLWLSAAAAYDGLPANLQQFLGGLTAVHDLAKSFPPERFGSDSDSNARLEQAKRANPPVSHPVIRTHPVSGRKTIYVSEGFTTRIEGLEADASDALLGFLYRHLAKPEFQVRWRWRAGMSRSGTIGLRSIMRRTIIARSAG